MTVPTIVKAELLSLAAGYTTMIALYDLEPSVRTLQEFMNERGYQGLATDLFERVMALIAIAADSA